MTAVAVNPKVIEWARMERGLSVEKAAERLRWPVEDILAFETGVQQPNLSQLEHIAAHYKLPLVSLLMPAPLPNETRPKLDDFRSFDGIRPRNLAEETILAIEMTFGHLDDIIDLKETDSAAVTDPTVPSCALSDDPRQVASVERKRLRVSLAEQFGWKKERQAFLTWREVIEAQGVFVYQYKLGSDGTRGFAVWDNAGVPIIVVDAGESGYPAKIFTLLHEYAHILLRRGGISDQNRSNQTERFCNKFAAYFLMPEAEFMVEASNLRPANGVWGDYQVGRLSSKFWVSKRVIAIHLEELNITESGFYARMDRLWQAGGKSSGGRASHLEKVANRLGSRFVNAVYGARKRGMLTDLDVHEITGIKPKYIEEVYKEVLKRQAEYGRPR